MRRRQFPLLLALCCVFVGSAVTASSPLHQPPVDAPIIDRFRPPPEPWLPGNRGIEYDTAVGQPVRASAAGTVLFAGSIGANRYITVRHSAALVTTYSFVEDLVVRRGQPVRRGQRLATANDRFHFGAKFFGRYIDPEQLFVAVPTKRVRLID